MKKLSILALSITAVLVGCGSDSDSNPGTGPNISPPKAAVVYDIEVQPSQLNYLDHINLDQSFKVIGKYDDGTEVDITDVAQWERMSGDEAVVEQGQVVSATGNTQFTVAYDSVVSDVVTLNAKSSICGASPAGDMSLAFNNKDENADGTCLKLVSLADSATLVTSGPSVSFVEALKYEEKLDEYSDIQGVYNAKKSANEDGPYSGVKFATMHNVGQFASYCNDLAGKNFAGRSDWRRTESDTITSVVNQGLDAHAWPHFGAGNDSYNYISGNEFGAISPNGTRNGIDHELAYLPTCESHTQDTVELDDLTYYRPLSESEAVAKGFIPDKTNTETGDYGPVGMVVSRFNWGNADNFCETIDMGGHADWRLPTLNELVSLYYTTDTHPLGAFNAYGWPTDYSAWSNTSTSNGTGSHYYVKLNSGYVNNGNDSLSYYVSCVR
ncbi:DUF1566 domain-containing protein [Vibrio aestuarianus]|uniref:Lcl domain-containing protein n=1 Tax=Vibrio aestuarianus TaxID=28171 RepID=UPI00237C95E1|nr:DUF1566 domain-containing protein [Vibrio aestuarianus]MDE1351536.1 DUF1566 domain-containing protein [Vibrio aestuarianus]